MDYMKVSIKVFDKVLSSGTKSGDERIPPLGNKGNKELMGSEMNYKVRVYTFTWVYKPL